MSDFKAHTLYIFSTFQYGRLYIVNKYTKKGVSVVQTKFEILLKLDWKLFILFKKSHCILPILEIFKASFCTLKIVDTYTKN